jgi:nucleoid-associated protein YgaU
VTRRLRAASALTAWLAFLLSVVVVLHAVGGRLAPPPLSSLEGGRAWLEQRQPPEVVFAVLRLLTLALGWYLLAVTIVSVVARLLRLAAVVAVIDVVTVPSVRRLVNAAVGLSLVASGYPGLAAAAESAPPAVEIMRRLPDAPGAGAVAPPEPASAPTVTMHRLPDEPGDEASVSPSPQPTPATAPTPAPAPAAAPSPRPAATSPSTQATAAPPEATTREPTPAAAAATPPTAPAPAVTTPPAPMAPGAVPGSWSVRPGDHFWAIAEQVLADAWGRPPTDAEVGRYWRTLVETNRSRLPDPANPDLLFPGQSLTVPPPPARPA